MGPGSQRPGPHAKGVIWRPRVRLTAPGAGSATSSHHPDMRWAALGAIGCSAIWLSAAVAGKAADGPQRTIPCGEIVDVTRFPYLGSFERRHRYRLVLGAVSVPPAYLEQVVPTGQTPWTHFSKRGMVVRSGRSVRITVPQAWRRRVGIVWGNAGHGVFSSIRIAACGSDPSKGNAYAGGFYLRRPSECVPLVFRVGSRSQVVRFGVGRRCR
jgi:hypothetical protein